MKWKILFLIKITTISGNKWKKKQKKHKEIEKLPATAVLAENDTFLTEKITQDSKRFITQSKHIIFW